MAKTFYTSGTGSQQTLTGSQDEKVAVYQTLADAEADLANLEAGQIVATPDTGDENAQPVDVIQAGNMHAVTSNAVAEQVTVEAQNESTPYSQRINADRDKSFISKIIGASFANNQLLKNNNFTSTSDWIVNTNRATFTVANNIGSLSNYQDTNPFITQTRTFYANHKYLLSIWVVCNQTGAKLDLGLRYDWASVSYKTYDITTAWVMRSAVLVANANTNRCAIIMQKTDFDSNTTVQFRNVNLIDLTQMFGSAIADRIYAMEQASAGSGLAWIKSFGFFTRDYYSYDEGSVINVHPTAYKISSSLVRSYVSRNVATQYNICLYADVILKPNTNYKLYFRGANGANIYPNEYIFTSSASIVLNGELQSVSLTTRSDFGSISVSIGSTKYDSGWIIFKNRGGNTVVPNFTEFYIVEEGINTDPTYSVSNPLANIELRGVPELDTDNNLIYDGDVYYPNGDVIRKYGIVNLGSLTWSYSSSTAFFYAYTGVKGTFNNKNHINGKGYVACNNHNTLTDKGICLSDVANTSGMNVEIKDTAYTDATAIKNSLSGVYLVYELATPTKETVAGYSNPHTLIRKGAEEFVDNRTVYVPTGHETEYAKLPEWLSDNVIFL